MLTRYLYWALCVQSDSARKLINVNYGSDTWGQWGLILTQLVNGYVLNFSVFRSVWISEMLKICSRVSFLWLLQLCERLCVCVPCLRLPPKEENTSDILSNHSRKDVSTRYSLIVC